MQNQQPHPEHQSKNCVSLFYKNRFTWFSFKIYFPCFCQNYFRTKSCLLSIGVQDEVQHSARLNGGFFLSIYYKRKSEHYHSFQTGSLQEKTYSTGEGSPKVSVLWEICITTVTWLDGSWIWAQTLLLITPYIIFHLCSLTFAPVVWIWV